MDKLVALQAFVKVAELKSFSAAAARLGVSKSVVSRTVSSLEADLGARLFHRTTRSLTLTEAGRGYYGRASRILVDLAEADQSVSELQAAPRGELRINAPMSFGFLHLAPALPDFLRAYPDVSIDMMMNDRFVDLVDEGFDIAVRIGELQDSSLIARKLASIKMTICASPDYLSRAGVPLTPEDLRLHQCLCNKNVVSAREWRFVYPDRKSMIVEVEGRVSINNGDALRIAALNGLGLIKLPTFIVGADLRQGTLVSVLADFLPQEATLSAVYPHARHLSPKVRAFVDFLADRFGPEPYWDDIGQTGAES